MAEAPIAAPARVNGGGFDDFTADVQGYDNSKINCPFHEDKTPSCQLYAAAKAAEILRYDMPWR